MAHLPLRQSNAVAHLTKLVLALSLASIASTGGAKTYSSDLGTLGPTYEIKEPDLLEDITATLRKKEASGELARIQAEGRQRAIASIREPKPVQGCPRRSKSEPLCRSSIEPGLVADQRVVSCG